MEVVYTFWPNDVAVPEGWERVTEEDIEKAKRICEIIKKRRLPSEKILILPKSE
ncbi:MAG: MbtH family NRPS accessory protein [Methanotrichaceae archaeon]|nr:MbtH family NRPS accessory protein [Methanotrichaceae archaeon]